MYSYMQLRTNLSVGERERKSQGVLSACMISEAINTIHHNQLLLFMYITHPLFHNTATATLYRCVLILVFEINGDSLIANVSTRCSSHPQGKSVMYMYYMLCILCTYVCCASFSIFHAENK